MRGYVEPVSLEDLAHIYQQFGWPAEQVSSAASASEEKERPGGTAREAGGSSEEEGGGSSGKGSQASL